MGVQSTLRAIATTAARLCEAHDAQIFLRGGTSLRVAAQHGSLRTAQRPGEPFPLSDRTVSGRAVLERRVIHVRDLKAVVRTQYPDLIAHQRGVGVRTILAAPLGSKGAPVGVILIRRTKVQPFTKKQISLLKTFADQAAIALENARLSEELGARNRELTEALEQQTATAEILGTISRTPTDLRPVLETLVNAAARFCGAANVALLRLDGGTLRGAAATGPFREEIVRSFGSIEALEVPATLESVSGRAVVERRTLHIHDLAAEPESKFPVGRELQRRLGHRTLVAAPLLREGTPIGTILLSRAEVRPFSDKQLALLQTFADQAVIAIENVRLFTELEARNRDLSVALDRQTVTSEILRVIGSSPTDAQPVFDAIARSAVRLLGGFSGAVLRLVGDHLHLAAITSTSETGDEAIRGRFPVPLAGAPFSARVVRERAPGFVSDMETEASVPGEMRKVARARGYRSVLQVPMLREGTPIGVISVTRREPGPFAPNEIALLQTFADQAVIAIENVRLFKELEARNRDLTEALEQQTATGEILRVISESQTDVQPVFDTIVRSAARLCNAVQGNVQRFDGELMHVVATHDWTPEAREIMRTMYPMRPDRSQAAARAVLNRAVVHIPDVLEDHEYSHEIARAGGWRSVLSVPMLREGNPVGVITVSQAAASPFSDTQIELLKAFADQAVIAIENVRLFKELEVRNRDLTEALEQQTATGEILRAISTSTTDAQPVFQSIAESAVRLCGALFGSVYRFDGELIHMVAQHNYPPAALEFSARAFPTPPTRQVFTGRAILERGVVHVPDVAQDPERNLAHELADVIHFRSVISVPMLREGSPIGAITLWHSEVGAFSDKHAALLRTFADQAVIAIENVRLFKELQARTGELTRSVEQLTALGEVSRAVSSTLDVETVLNTIVSRANQLASADGCVIYEYDEATEHFHVRATDNLDADFVEAIRRLPIRKGEGIAGRAAEMREPFQVADITQPGAYDSSLRDVVIRAGYRAALSVPLLREDQIIGSLSLTRKTPGEFPREDVEALKTFATQSALAIQNARLFHEIEDKSRQLEIASRHKSQFLANMSHELRTPLNAILGYTELLQDNIYGEIPEKARETMARIERGGRHLLALINDVLDLSKIEAGQLALSLVDYSLREVVHTVVTAMEPLAAEKGLELKVTLDPDLPLGRGDERRLSQVLLNLVGNAIKFTDAGEVRIEAKAPDGAFLVSVSDTGPGIAAEDQARIFEEFQQADTSNTRTKGGTGLGLSIARRILALHGGRIWVESAPSQGSTFSFTLPVRVERMAEAT